MRFVLIFKLVLSRENALRTKMFNMPKIVFLENFFLSWFKTAVRSSIYMAFAIKKIILKKQTKKRCVKAKEKRRTIH